MQITYTAFFFLNSYTIQNMTSFCSTLLWITYWHFLFFFQFVLGNHSMLPHKIKFLNPKTVQTENSYAHPLLPL